jgi:TetR/AcrR family transcriptional repressor of nem operon
MTDREANSTRDRILEAARRLFHEQGYHATGISTILREAGVNSGSLYHFFKSKDELLVGVLEYYIHLLHPVVMGPAEQAAGDGIDRIFVLLTNYRDGLASLDFRMGCPIGNLALEVADDNAAARRLITQNFENWAAVVRSWLESAKDRLPRGTDFTSLSRFVLTVMEGGMMQARTARDLAPMDQSIEHLHEYFALLAARAEAERSVMGGASGDRR